MRDPRAAVREYSTGRHRAEAAPRPPRLLMQPLRERLRLIAAGELAVAEWLAAADEWSATADERYRACVELRPAGQPVRLAVKDTIDVAGFPTRLGLRRHRHYPRRSAVALRGLPVNAKVVTTELNIGIGSGCVNPYFPHIDPAGSSTGSGVAVAAGICDVSLGTDVLGSVRWPAGRCGVVGLRTTHSERRLAGVFPLSPSMDAPGWVARAADDLAVLADRIGLDGDGAPGQYRIGLVREVLDGGCEPEILTALELCHAALADAGHRVEGVRLGELWRCRGMAWDLCAREAWDGYQVWRQWISDDLLDSTRRALEAGARIGDGRYAELRAEQQRQRAGVAELFARQEVDAWLLPLDPDVPCPPDAAERVTATSIPTPADDPAGYDRAVGYTPVASFAGLPAITFPVGRGTTTGAPLAMQLVGPPRSDRRLVALAADVGRRLGDLGFVPR
ncbi:MAG TPA: amidase [Mycobacteriales bacterium]|nr:amidase [Mycobacteriales bacterium]